MIYLLYSILSMFTLLKKELKMSTVGERIRNKRLELGYTQENLAKKLGYKNRSSVNQMENSVGLPLSKIERLAEALNVTPSYLMGWDINVNQNNNNYTTNNYYSGCGQHAINRNIKVTINSKEYFFELIDYLRNMTDEQLLDMIKYAKYILNR